MAVNDSQPPAARLLRSARTCATPTPRDVTWAQEIFSIGIFSSEHSLGPQEEEFLGARAASRGLGQPGVAARPDREAAGAGWAVVQVAHLGFGHILLASDIAVPNMLEELVWSG
jgi:hypothetical protein